MLNKINEFKGVIIFYLLLIGILIMIANHNRKIDMRLNASYSNTYMISFSFRK